ncbi:helix-turn-helix transcriptional regulator [Mycobacterium sp. LTG2003]
MVTANYLTGGEDTRSAAVREQTDVWSRHVAYTQGQVDCAFESPEGFIGGTRLQRCGDIGLVKFWSEPVSYVRRRRVADSDNDDSLRLLLPLSGDLLISGPSADRQLRPGVAAAAVSMSAGFRIEHKRPAAALVLSIPGRLWQGAMPRDPAVMELDQGSGAVAGAMLRAVAEQGGHLDAASFVQACESAAMLVTGQHGDVDLTSQARAVVRQHCDDIRFDPSALAELLGWSLRSLQLALRRAGTTPAELIRNERLERAAARLRHPAWRQHTVSHIAFASGFGSLSAFNAAFRSRFGYTPTDLRAGMS